MTTAGRGLLIVLTGMPPRPLAHGPDYPTDTRPRTSIGRIGDALAQAATGSQRRFDGAKVQYGDVRGLGGRESGGDQAFFEPGALPACPDVFLRLPDTDDVQRVLAGRAVMPQFAELLGAAGRHDHCVRAVVGTGEFGYVP